MTVRSFLPPRSGPFNPPEILRQLRERDPITKVTLWDGSQAWLVTRYNDARLVLRDPRFSADASNPGMPSLSPGRVFPSARRTMSRMGEPRHGELRHMLAAEFTMERVDELRPAIERIVTEQIDSMLEAATPVDLHAAFAAPVASRLICELLGAPLADQQFLRDRTKILMARGAPRSESWKAADELSDYCARLVTRKLREPSDDVLGRLAARELRGGRLSHEELSLIARLLMVAGHATTPNMISLATLTMLLSPGWFPALAEAPEVMPNAVEELLRYHTPIHEGLPRVAVRDVTVGGVTIPAGDAVVVSLASSNRDGTVFDCPNELNPKRRGADRHLTFGYGAHGCLAQTLTRAELQIALRALAIRIPTLQLAVPFSNISFTEDMYIYGVEQLPVTW
jgi:cytochrome P450